VYVALYGSKGLVILLLTRSRWPAHLAVAVFDDAALAESTALCAGMALRRLALGRTARAAGYGSRRGGGFGAESKCECWLGGFRVGVSAREAEVLAAVGST
jgi:hypothetical protein